MCAYIVGLHVTDTGLLSSAASSLPVQPDTVLSQKQKGQTSKRPLISLESKSKRRKLQVDIQVIKIAIFISL